MPTSNGSAREEGMMLLCARGSGNLPRGLPASSLGRTFAAAAAGLRLQIAYIGYAN